jgi:hypothetical protein
VYCQANSSDPATTWSQTQASTTATSTCNTGYYSGGTPTRNCTQSGSSGVWQAVVGDCTGNCFLNHPLLFACLLSSCLLSPHSLFIIIIIILSLGCGCSSPGSIGTGCNSGGVCSCNTGFTGTKCNQCLPGYYGASCQRITLLLLLLLFDY